MSGGFCNGECLKQFSPANDTDGYKSWLPIGIHVKQLHFQLNSDTIDPN